MKNHPFSKASTVSSAEPLRAGNGFANIAIVILVVVVAAGLGYFAFKNSNTQNQTTGNNQTQASSTAETANWQIYRNEKYGFEFKYPADWKYKPVDLNILKNSQATEYYGLHPSEILLAASLNESSLFVSNYINCENESTWLLKDIRANPASVVNKSNVIVNGIKSPTVSYSLCGSSATPSCFAQISVCIPNKPSISIHFTDGKELNGKPTPEIISISNKILSTFKFTQ